MTQMDGDVWQHMQEQMLNLEDMPILSYMHTVYTDECMQRWMHATPVKYTI